MLDRIIIVIMLLAFAGFTGIIVVHVREPDLTVTIVLMVAFAFQDFWISVVRPGATPSSTRRNIEERPSPISGKPLAGPDEGYAPRH
jgi:hypothetical protein